MNLVGRLNLKALLAWQRATNESGEQRYSSHLYSEGDEVWIKCIGFADRGKVKLSMRLVDQETGEELPDTRHKGGREERAAEEAGAAE